MSLLQMSAAGAVMILAIAVIRALTINRVPKKTFLALWCAALMRLLIPFSIPSGASIYSLLEGKISPDTAGAPAAVFSVLPSGHAAAALPQSSPAPTWPVSAWSVVWAAGMLLCTAFFAVAYLRCYREFRMSLPVDNAFAGRWLCEHPMRRIISIRQSDRIASPLTFGVLRPVILMPKKTDWADEKALQYILEHELVHIRRFDTISKLLLIAAVCVHWFNPFAWVMYILANRDLELSCDETVVRRFGGGARAAYAGVLISMEETWSGFTPLCNHFSKSAIEERITAIMKTKKITVISLLLAVVIVAGTVTVFATSARNDEAGTPAAQSGAPAAGAEAFESAAASSGGAEAVESGEPLKPSGEYTAAGITGQGSLWFYQGRPVAMIYDDNGGFYMDGEVTDGVYLNIRRNEQGGISEVAMLSKEAFRELADRSLNANPPASTLDESSLMSYVDPSDGRTYYSFDDGRTFTPLTDAEFEARFPTPDVEWWTYDEYKARLDAEKAQLRSMLGESEGSFVWTQEKIDETIALYESILKDIENGVMYSKSVDGQDDQMVSCNPTDVAAARDA